MNLPTPLIIMMSDAFRPGSTCQVIISESAIPADPGRPGWPSVCNFYSDLHWHWPRAGGRSTRSLHEPASLSRHFAASSSLFSEDARRGPPSRHDLRDGLQSTLATCLKQTIRRFLNSVRAAYYGTCGTSMLDHPR